MTVNRLDSWFTMKMQLISGGTDRMESSVMPAATWQRSVPRPLVKTFVSAGCFWRSRWWWDWWQPLPSGLPSRSHRLPLRAAGRWLHPARRRAAREHHEVDDRRRRTRAARASRKAEAQDRPTNASQQLIGELGELGVLVGAGPELSTRPELSAGPELDTGLHSLQRRRQQQRRWVVVGRAPPGSLTRRRRLIALGPRG